MTGLRIGALLWLACLAIPLTGCDNAEPPPPPKDEHKALQRAIQEPLDKARAVEGQLQEQQKAMQRQLDEAER